VGTVWNIRGTNGSGKSTLARALLPPRNRKIVLLDYEDPTKANPNRRTPVYGHVGHIGPKDAVIGHVGPYDKATGGMDAINRFAYQQEACRVLLGMRDLEGVDHVVAEGLLAAHVYGSWAALDRELEAAGHRFAFVYLMTSLEECHRRVIRRQEAAGKVRDIKWDLVDSQYRQILKTRDFALRDGRLVYDVPEGDADQVGDCMLAIMAGHGEVMRAG
jgi:hypothetical protein